MITIPTRIVQPAFRLTVPLPPVGAASRRSRDEPQWEIPAGRVSGGERINRGKRWQSVCAILARVAEFAERNSSNL